MTEEFNDVHEFLRFKCNQLYDGNEVRSSNSINKNTLKEELIELPSQFFCIKNPRATIFNLENLRTIPWWMCGEILTEFLALNPPLMNKYSPDIINGMYKLTPQGTCEYLYGVRWMEHNQIENVRQRLSENPNSKKCLIQTFMPYDSSPEKIDSPCNVGYMFLSRNNKLNMTAIIRSNDIIRGVKYDYFLASFMQQSMASWTNMEIGNLYFLINSLHVYKKDLINLEKIINELSSNNKSAVSLELDSNIDSNRYWKNLREIKKCEEASYCGNFNYFEKSLEDIDIKLFRDFARVFGIKNAKHYNKCDLMNKYKNELELKDMCKWINKY